MSGQNEPKVAILGMSEAGRGWATLVSGAGWQVTIYDPDAAQLHEGEVEFAT
jgi:3-hydroxyacyl-CoA dehydrogenase